MYLISALPSVIMIRQILCKHISGYKEVLNLNMKDENKAYNLQNSFDFIQTVEQLKTSFYRWVVPRAILVN